MKDQMKRHNLFLQEAVVDKLKKMAERQNTSYSELIRQAVDEFLEKHGRSAARRH